MSVLLLRLAAPLQAWGSSSKFDIRTTEREPTKSGVIGMIASALSIQRNAENSDDEIKKLNKVRFGVRVEKEGKLIKDFHMAYSGKLSDSEKRHTSLSKMKNNIHLSERYYLSDAVFLVAIESDDTELLKKIESALQRPVYPLFLGRRSCPPTLPVVYGMRDSELTEVLRNEPPLIQDSKNKSARRIVYDTLSDGTVVRDCPVSFSQLHRQYGFRMKKEEILMPYEHDPMNEL